MNLKRIKTFKLLIEHKNFSVVANILNISQPAVSNQIKSLEEELGAILINRDTFEITETGRIVYQQGLQLLTKWEELVADCQALQQQLSGIIRIGASTIPGSYLVPTVLKKFRELFPRVEVNLYVNESEEIQRLLKNEKIDIAIIGALPRGDLFQSHMIAQDSIVLIGPADSDEVNGYGDIADKPFIFRGEQSGTWQAVEDGFKNWSKGKTLDQLHCVAKVHSTESVMNMVELGLGYSFVSHLAAQSMKQNQIKVIAELPIKRSLYLTYLKSKTYHPIVKEMIHLF